MRSEEINLESVAVERPDGHADLATYDTVTFRVFPAGHPNCFRVPISVNADQYPPDEVEAHARFVFHRIMKALAKATADWDRLDPRPLD